MKAYNEQWIYNREIVNQAERWHKKQLLTSEQMQAVRQHYPVEFRQTNGFIEIGLFLFTTVAILACYLLPSSIYSALFSDDITYGIFNCLFGIGTGLTGRLLIQRRSFYRNGVDNAFVVMQTGFVVFGLNQFLPNGLSVAAHCLFTLPFLLLVLWYYGDTLIAFFAIAAFYTFIFDGLLEFSWGKDALPFVMMAVSGILYVITRNPNIVLSQSVLRSAYYTDPLNLAQWLSLIVLAASGNYFVVRELNGLLTKPHPAEAPEISLAILFWLLTFVIPVLYLWQGIQKKDRMLIILGILGLIAAFITFHEYKALVPLNVALTIGGVVLVSLAITGIQYLRKPKNGFTDAPDDDSPDEFFLTSEMLTTIQAAAGASHAPKHDVKFGGGDFGGGGSAGKY